MWPGFWAIAHVSLAIVAIVVLQLFLAKVLDLVFRANSLSGCRFTHGYFVAVLTWSWEVLQLRWHRR